MKKFIQIFRVPLLIFAVFLVVGIICKVITDRRPEIEFVRANEECVTEERVFDYADKMTDAEEEELRAKISEAENYCGVDIIVVTLDESLEEYAKSYESVIGPVEPYQYTMVFADNFYDEGAFGFNEAYGDGIILVDNWYRESDGGVYSWISTSGKAIDIMTTDVCERVLDYYTDFVEDDPAYAYNYFVELAVTYLDPNTNLGDSLGGIFSVGIGLVAGLIFFFVNFGGKKGSSTVGTKTYVKSGKADVAERQDIFITKTMTRKKIETQTRSSGGSHVSAGGHSHGGGGHRR